MTRDTRTIIETVVGRLRKQYGKHLLGIAVFGSVALGEEREHSDVDLLVVLSLGPRKDRFLIYDRRLVSILHLAKNEAEAEVSEPSAALPEILSGWRNMKILYDPGGLIQRLKQRAERPPARLFTASARLTLLGAYEDLGKILNAFDSNDEDEVREMSIWFTLAAAHTLACLQRQVFSTDRRIFLEIRNVRPVGKLIWRLRYGEMSPRQRVLLARRIWSGLLKKAQDRGLNIEKLILTKV